MLIAIGGQVGLVNGQRRLYQPLPDEVSCNTEESCHHLPGYCCDKNRDTRDDGSPDYNTLGSCVPKAKAVECYKNSYSSK